MNFLLNIKIILFFFLFRHAFFNLPLTQVAKSGYSTLARRLILFFGCGWKPLYVLSVMLISEWLDSSFQRAEITAQEKFVRNRDTKGGKDGFEIGRVDV